LAVEPVPLQLNSRPVAGSILQDEDEDAIDELQRKTKSGSPSPPGQKSVPMILSRTFHALETQSSMTPITQSNTGRIRAPASKRTSAAISI
jgi:hypothetical protein